MISIQNVTKRYGSHLAVGRLNLEVRDGEMFAFLGPNGAGKTTTIKMSVGLLRPDEGTISIGGVDIVKDPVGAKRIMAYIPDRPYLYEKLTGREYLTFTGDLYGVPRNLARARGEEWLARFELKGFADEFVGSYSHGMRQKLVFAGAFLQDPKVYIIDEPLVGLDPSSVRKIKNVLGEECRRGKTVFLSTHTLSMAEELADRIGIIHHGELLACGTLDDIRGHAAASGHRGAKLEELFLQLTEGEEESASIEADPGARRQIAGIR